VIFFEEKRDNFMNFCYKHKMSLDPLYTQKLLDYAANIPRLGHLPNPDAVAHANAKLCGSSITVEINVANGIITDYAHLVEACALGKTSASIVARHIVGRPVDEIAGLYTHMSAFLKGEAEAPSAFWQEQGEWGELELLASIRPYPQRHASTLLVFEALAKAIATLPSGQTR
jgi:NifU-like protein involved in Fe-S cluster formation